MSSIPPHRLELLPIRRSSSRSRSYLALLVFGAAIGVPVAAAAYFFLKGVDAAQQYLYAPSRASSGSMGSRCGGRFHSSR